MNNEELSKVIGGASSISGTFLNSISKLINTILELGRIVGSSIRYHKENVTCPVKK